jgi:hypothetical protein
MSEETGLFGSILASLYGIDNDGLFGIIKTTPNNPFDDGLFGNIRLLRNIESNDCVEDAYSGCC